MQPRKGKVVVYRAGFVWYAECPDCPGEDQRMRAPWLPYTHSMAMKHVQLHRAGVAL